MNDDNQKFESLAHFQTFKYTALCHMSINQSISLMVKIHGTRRIIRPLSGTYTFPLKSCKFLLVCVAKISRCLLLVSSSVDD